MSRITILALSTLLLGACNDHPLVGLDYQHYTGEAPDTDGDGDGDSFGGFDPTPLPDLGAGDEGGTWGSSTGGPGPDSGDDDSGGSDTGGVCGDGEVDPGEVCDDGDLNGEPGFCSDDCLTPPAT